jgi:hypothetical protein
MPKAKFVLDTDVKSAILKKIASEVAKIGGTAGLNSYYKDPNGGPGGVYGKGSFGKSDPTVVIEAMIDVSTKERIAEGVAKAEELMRRARR